MKARGFRTIYSKKLFRFFRRIFLCRSCFFGRSRRRFLQRNSFQSRSFQRSVFRRIFVGVVARAIGVVARARRQLLNGSIPILQAGVSRAASVLPDVISSFSDSIFIQVFHLHFSVEGLSKNRVLNYR